MTLKGITAAALAGLALAACGGSTSSTVSSAPTPTAASSSDTSAASPGGIEVRLSDFKLSPGALSAKPGPIAFDVKNDGPTPHNLTIKDQAGKTVGATRDLKPGESAVLTITLPAGAYSAICSLPGHASLGMRDTLTVG